MDGFLANPQRVWEWYQHRRQIVEHVQPNSGHVALAEFERIIPHFTLITQNVDRLHQRAGSRNVLELHGNLEENRCVDCNELHTGAIDTSVAEPQTCVHCGGRLRPNVVWFGEDLPHDVFHEAEAAATQCDVFMSIGTSAEVYPAADLPFRAKQFGAFVVEVNASETALTPHVHANLRGPSGEILPRLLAQLTVNA
jgi:NAD-dependent deacetylase